MASPGVIAIFEAMYTFNRSTSQVRTRAPRYGAHSPGSDPFPAATALADLTAAPDHAVPFILARYAVLRCWLLGASPAGAALHDHAREAARAYLGVTPDGWPEKATLERLLDRPRPFAAAARLLARAAAQAEASGHRHGALAARRAAGSAAALGAAAGGGPGGSGPPPPP